ncbi:MAG: 5'-nucleotidase C-terminal domain-containing protein [Lachnospirales bacterium]
MLKSKFVILATLTMTLGSSLVVYGETIESTVPKEFVIYHTNDTHSRVDVFPLVETLVDDSVEEGSNVLYFDCGDTVHGQPIATTLKGQSIVDILNTVSVNAMTTGNHEYNYGLDRLIELTDQLGFPVVASNVYYKDTEDHIFEDYFVYEVDGVKFGVFGLATPETYSKTNPNNVVNVTFADPEPEAERVTKILKEKEDCDVVISIAHLGVDESTVPEFRSTYVAENVDDIDIMIDGHSHTVFENGVMAGDTLVVQTGEYGNNIGKISFDYEDGVVDLTSELIATKDADGNAVIEADEDVLAVISEIEAEVEVVNGEVVANSEFYLEGTREVVRTAESNLANLITDAMIAETGADIAITNGGGIRASIEAGDITKGDVVTVLPFGNFLTTQTLTGAEILETLEHGYSSLGEPAGFFAQIGGLNVILDASKEVGERIISATFDDGTPIEADKEYTVATNDFMAAGGDDYVLLAQKKDYVEYNALDEIVIDYLNSGDVVINEYPIGRIAVLQDDAVVPDPLEPVVEPEPETPVVEEPVVEPEPDRVTPVTPDTTSDTLYTVVAGDTLSEIAFEYGMTYQELADFNNIENPHLIFIGDEIYIPTK